MNCIGGGSDSGSIDSGSIGRGDCGSSGGDSGDAVMILFVSHTRTQVPWYLTAVRTSWYAYHMHMSYTA